MSVTGIMGWPVGGYYSGWLEIYSGGRVLPHLTSKVKGVLVPDADAIVAAAAAPIDGAAAAPMLPLPLLLPLLLPLPLPLCWLLLLLLQVPLSDLDLDTIYQQLLQPTSLLQRLGSNQAAAQTHHGSNEHNHPELDGPGTTAGAGAAAAETAEGALVPAAAAAAGCDDVTGGSCGGDMTLGSLTPQDSSSCGVGYSGVESDAGLYADLFRWYDKNKTMALERDEFMVRKSLHQQQLLLLQQQLLQQQQWRWPKQPLQLKDSLMRLLLHQHKWQHG